jgi:hypothetical protein
MALQYEYPVISTGNIGTVIDTYSNTITTQPPTNTPSWPNGALNPIGAAFLLPPNSLDLPVNINYPSASGSLNSNGWGAPLIVRYVRYNSTTAANWLATPAPVYWTDETYTTVTGTFSEGLPAATGNLNSFAGYAWINTAIYPGSKTGAQLTTLINGNFIFIVTKGFLPGAYVPGSTAIGDSLAGVTGNFTLQRTASGTAPISRRMAIAQTAIASGAADVLVDTDLTF